MLLNLPNRHKSHIQSEKAIRTIKKLLPIDWIIREISPDYGIDIEIEIWKEEPTGRVSYAQVKSIENFSTYENKGYPIKISTLNYLNTKENSFLIFVWGELVEIIRVKELVDIFISYLNIGVNLETITIPLSFKKFFHSEERESFYSSEYSSIRASTMLSGQKNYYFPENEKKRVRVEEEGVYKLQNFKPVIYFSEFESENNFWELEFFLNLSFYYFNRKPYKNIIDGVEKYYYLSNSVYDKAGILFFFATQRKSKKWTQSEAEQLTSKKNNIILQTILPALVTDECNKNYKLLFFISQFGLYPFIKLKDEISEIEINIHNNLNSLSYENSLKSAIFGLSLLNSNEGIQYLINSYQANAYPKFQIYFYELLVVNIKLKKYRKTLLEILNSERKEKLEDINLQDYLEALIDHITDK